MHVGYLCGFVSCEGGRGERVSERWWVSEGGGMCAAVRGVADVTTAYQQRRIPVRDCLVINPQIKDSMQKMWERNGNKNVHRLTVVETLKCKTRPSQTWGMTKVPHAVNSRCNQLTNRKWHLQKMVLIIFPATHLFFHLPCSLLAQLDQTLPADWTSRVMRPPEKGHREITGVNTKVYWDQWPPVM